jgi:16S rRNA G966 N2-methylase RsmD
MNTPAELAGVVEDHRYEQFFYDESTAKQLYQIVQLYERPLLMCNPTLALLADRDNQQYKLLDRDTRFDFLEGYEEFSLTEPHLIKDYQFDSVFIDPPFANVTPDQVAKCLRLIAADGCRLWVAYNSKREEQLLSALNELDCPDLVPKWKLSYKEGVSESTQDAIWLYGPADLVAS